MVKGLSTFSVFNDYVIKKVLVLWIPRNIKRRKSVSFGKVEYDICLETSHTTPVFSHSRVVPFDDLVNPKNLKIHQKMTY